MDPALAKKALKSALMRVIAAEPDITNYDTIVGDGDCGIGLKRGAEGEFSVIYIEGFLLISGKLPLRCLIERKRLMTLPPSFIILFTSWRRTWTGLQGRSMPYS